MRASALDSLKGANLNRWSNIDRAASMSHEKLTELAGLVGDLLPADEGSFVVFGSLARAEYTTGSDLDWIILVDGRADSLHLDIVHALKQKLEHGGFKSPGPTDLFGGLVFSHELVHAIGGDEDTNRNMTRRLLLLLESIAVGPQKSAEVHKRILTAILSRYVKEDANFIIGNRNKDRIPRFLLNDVVRLWRTMAVDYANKYRARAGQKWALRNIKLRMSRKLIFVSGLLMCLSWAFEDHGDSDDFAVQKLVSHLLEWTQRAPLESLAIMVETYAPSLSEPIFSCYDAFLGVLGDDTTRKVLERLSPDEAYESPEFLAVRENAKSFDSALTSLLFEESDGLARLVKKYGVF